MIIIICDATKEIGYGHVKRCLVLASFYRQLGMEVRFLMRTILPAVKDLMHRHNMNWVVRTDHAACWAYLFETKDLIKLVVIDHYEIGADLEKSLFEIFPVLVIDDLCRPHWCDVLVDQTLGREERHYDKKLYNAYAQVLLGSRYTLIDPVYKAIKSAEDRCNILITFGATDPGKAALRVLEILENHLEKTGVVFYVPLSSLSPCLDALKKRIPEYRLDIRLYEDLPDLCFLYERCGIAIGAPGTSLLERIYCGQINLTIVVAENQREVSRNFTHEGVTVCLGDIQHLDPLELIHKLVQIMDSPEYGAVLQKKAMGLLDGRGPVRIIKQTISLISPVILRSADKGDLDILYAWQHEKGARKYFNNTGLPTKTEHQIWLDTVLSNDDVTLKIIEWCNIPIGYIRLNGKSENKTVSILIAKKFQGFGFAKKSLLEIIKTEKQCYTAVIHPENKASIGLFTSVGFHSKGKGEYIYSESA